MAAKPANVTVFHIDPVNGWSATWWPECATAECTSDCNDISKLELNLQYMQGSSVKE